MSFVVVQAHILRYKAWYMGFGFAAFLVLLSLFLTPTDHLPVVWAARIELAGGSAYGPEMDALFHEYWDEPFASAGFAYPLTAIWFGLPIAFLPDVLLNMVACVICLGSVGLGLHLLRMPVALVLFAPVLWGIQFIQLTTCLMGLTLIAIWAARERRWWLMIILLVLISATKPQTTLLPGLFLALYALRAGHWKPLLIIGAVVISLPFALEPDWVTKWITSAQRYTNAIPAFWHYYFLPIGLWFLWKRHWWAGIAISQIALFPMLFHPYVLSPLILAYIPLKSNRFTWFMVACSWCVLLLPFIMPYWLTLTLSYIVPICICYYLKNIREEAEQPSSLAAIGTEV